MKDKELNSYLLGKLEKKNFEIAVILIAFLISLTCCIIKLNNMEDKIKEQTKINENLKTEFNSCCYWLVK